MNELPIARGVFLCEKVIVEEATRYMSLINCFSHIRVTHFPAQPWSFVLFAVLSNGRGRIRLETVVEYLNSPEVVERRSGILEFADPRQEIRFRARFMNVSFREAGSYEFRLLADGEPVASTLLHVARREEPDE